MGGLKMPRASLPFSYAWRNVLARKLSTAVTLSCVAVSVMVYVVMISTADGIERVAVSSGDPRNLVVLSTGANSAESSRLSPASVARVRYFPGIARDGGGAPLASVELQSAQAVRRADAENVVGEGRFTPVRGVTPVAFQVHTAAHLVKGRLPREPGEILVGRLLAREFGGLEVGGSLHFASRSHRVVGVFEARGQVFEGEIWMELDSLKALLDQRDVSQVVVRPADPRLLSVWQERLRESRRLQVDVRRETDYYADMGRGSQAFSYLGNLIGLILGLGAVAAGMNSTYAALSGRVREMGTLRALGFGRGSVGSTLLVESCLIGAVGGVLGVLLALLFDGFALSLMGLAFELHVQPASLGEGLALALAIGAVGGLLPARAAARLEIIEALRHA